MKKNIFLIKFKNSTLTFLMFLGVFFSIAQNSYGQATLVGSFSNCENGNVTSNTVSIPAGSVDDLLIAAVSSDESGTINETFTAPSGWTQLISGNTPDTDASLAIFWKVATTATEGNATFTVSQSDEICVAIVRYDKVIIPASGNPIEASNIASNNSGTANPPAITTISNNSTVVNIVSVDGVVSLGQTGTIQRVDDKSDANSLGIADQQQATAGSIDPSNWTHNSQEWVAVTLSFQGADPCDSLASGNLDTDGDGISDMCDLDDDNDGILDTNEGLCTTLSGFDWDIQSVSTSVPSNTSSTFSGNTVTVTFSGNGWGAANPNITQTGGNARNLLDDDDLNGSGSGDDAFLRTRGDNGDIYNIVTENNRIDTDVVFSKSVDVLKFSFADVDFSDFVSIYAVDANGNTIFPNYTSPSGVTTQWVIYEPTDANNPVPNRRTVVGNGQGSDTPASTVYVDFDGNYQIKQVFIRTGYLDSDGFYDIPDTNNNANGGGNQGNSLIFAGDYLFCSSRDTDNDGISDFIDTDSDNDGCFDALEGGNNILANAVDANGRLTGTANASTNGVPNNVSATTGQPVGTSANNAAFDSFGQCDQDNDGVVDADDVCNGFNDNADFDGDSIPDGCDVDDDNDGILDTVECPEFQGTFTGNQTGTISAGGFTADYAIVENSFVGYSGLAAYSPTADGIEIQGSSDSSTGNDSFNFTLNLSNVSPGVIPVIRMYQRSGSNAGNDEASDITVSFAGGELAEYVDEATPSASMYTQGAPAGFDLNNRQIEGVATRGSLASGDKFRTYQVNNSAAEWYVEFPAGETSITIDKTVLNFATSSTSGIDNRFPQLGFAFESGESFNEWLSFQVFFIPDVDSNGVADCKDTDSDDDGCPDAIEGAGSIIQSQLTTLAGGSAGGSSDNLGTVSASNGSPLLNASGTVGFVQSTTAAVTDAADVSACNADLSLLKTVDKSVLKVGDTVIFTLLLTNNGPGAATGVRVKDILPIGLTYNASASTIPINTTYTASTGIWDLSLLTVAKDQTIELKIAATVNSLGTILINQAEVFSNDLKDIDSTPNNNN